MKKNMILIGLLCFGYCIRAQSNFKTFNWNDTSFTAGSKRKIMIFFRPRIEDSFSFAVMDTVLLFMKKNPELKIAINCHLDQQGNYKMNMHLSQARAKSIVNYCIRHGSIDSTRLVPHGYGSQYPIISINEINKMKDRHKKDSLFQINRRTEIEILATDYK
jgi:OmpA family